MLRYLNRLNKIKDHMWPKKIFQWDLSLKTEGWSDQVKQILAYLQYDVPLVDSCPIDLDAVASALLRLNKQKWLVEATTKSKLRTFLEIYDEEDARAIIQSNLNRSQRSILAKLKIGILLLKIESGRWKDTPLGYRACKVCEKGYLENEYHFILKCEGLSDIRTQYCVELHDKVGITPSETEGELVMQLLSKEALKISGRYLERMYLRRRELLNTNS